MTIRNLDRMLEPRSVALIGASSEPGSVGLTVAQNLLAGGFKGPIGFVNPKRHEILGHPCYPNVEALPEGPDLAIVAVPPAAVPGTIAALGAKGTRAAVVITAGLGPAKRAALDAARPYCLRILGPNCIGLMLPHLGLNGSFAHRAPLAGEVAFLTQSGALVTAVVDWAASNGIGFSQVVSLGEMGDVDFGDMLDYLATDRQSRAILLYMEQVTSPAKFLSAARRAARVKPVIVVKSGRHEAGARAAMSHTGALAGSDAAYDAAFRRTGLLRVKTLDELFAAAETLAHAPKLFGERLAILTNGGGAGVLAADELQDAAGVLSELSPATISALNAVLPPTWSHGNPVDIIGDAGADRYRDALAALLEDERSDAVLVIECPTATQSPADAAQAVISVVRARAAAEKLQKPVLTNWLGADAPREARRMFTSAAIPTFATPGEAITGFMQLVRHTRAQRELMRTPPATASAQTSNPDAVTRQIQATLAEGRKGLTMVEAKAVLSAYGIKVAETFVAANADEVRDKAAKVLSQYQACVIKILSRDITHKSDVGGVRLGLESAAAAEQAAHEMLDRVRAAKPKARIDGFTVEPMIRRPNAQEVIVGMNVDPTFGPMILFGAGGTAVEVIRDSALALPPLDILLARQLVSETRIARLLAGYRDRPPADLDALADVLVRVSDLIIHHPEIRELDINPLIVDENGVLALDARISVADNVTDPRLPLSITPYPAQWERQIELPGLGQIDIRPIRPHDEPLYRKFFANVSPTDMRLRFMMTRSRFSHEFLAQLTQIDYAREMAFVAIDQASGDLIGVVRLVLDADLEQGEYAIIVRSDLQGRGLGGILMRLLIEYAHAQGVKRVIGLILAENGSMLRMATELGFEIRPVPEDSTMREAMLDVEKLYAERGADAAA